LLTSGVAVAVGHRSDHDRHARLGHMVSSAVFGRQMFATFGTTSPTPLAVMCLRTCITRRSCPPGGTDGPLGRPLTLRASDHEGTLSVDTRIGG
jgi:hypothetical protein